MRKIVPAAVVLSVLLALQGCSWITISDKYGNSYGGFFDYGNQYAWQLQTCQNDPALAKTPLTDQKRWMECCMWRHGVPIDDSTGCAAPPYFNG
jgi:hypothetical protein